MPKPTSGTTASSAARAPRPALETVFTPEFREDLAYWIETDRRIAKKVLELVEACTRDPFTGTGKPEPLKGPLARAWSRRITQEHRLVHVVKDDRIDFLQARYRY